MNKLLAELSQELDDTKKELADCRRQLQSANDKLQNLSHKGIDFPRIARQLSHYADLVQMPGNSALTPNPAIASTVSNKCSTSNNRTTNNVNTVSKKKTSYATAAKKTFEKKN